MINVKRFFVIMVGLVMLYACGSEKNVARERAREQSKTEKKTRTDPGKIVYMQFCLSCHMENGEGVPGLYPPLSQTKYVLGDKEWLIKNVLLGQQGPIEVKGQPYNNIMTKLDFLRDKQIAEVLTYVRSNFGNQASPVTEEEVRAVRNALNQ